MRILLVEDEHDLSSIIKKGLEEERYNVDTCFDGEDALFMSEEISYDAIILDIMLPKINGITLLRTIRSKGIATPVLMLTARDALEDKVKGLDTGADDYLTKPFEFNELLARLRALLRRNLTQRASVVKVRDLVLDTARKEARRKNVLISLTAKEYALLEYMVYNKNNVLSRTNISEHIYDSSFDLDSNVIDVFVSSLRKKLDNNHSIKLIKTVRGAGYMLTD